jgi:hypothetical protein
MSHAVAVAAENTGRTAVLKQLVLTLALLDMPNESFQTEDTYEHILQKNPAVAIEENEE